jgi:hypothetical protein
MTTEAFVTLESVVETPEGFLVHFRNGETGRLLHENPRFARIKELLEIGESLSQRVAWPVRIARSAEGVIENAWPAWRGQPIYVEDLVSEPACRVCFLLQNEHKFVKHDHPDFMRLLGTLMDATAEERDVFYFEQPGEKNILVDVCYAEPAAETADSR